MKGVEGWEEKRGIEGEEEKCTTNKPRVVGEQRAAKVFGGGEEKRERGEGRKEEGEERESRRGGE